MCQEEKRSVSEWAWCVASVLYFLLQTIAVLVALFLIVWAISLLGFDIGLNTPQNVEGRFSWFFGLSICTIVLEALTLFVVSRVLGKNRESSWLKAVSFGLIAGTILVLLWMCATLLFGYLLTPAALILFGGAALFILPNFFILKNAGYEDDNKKRGYTNSIMFSLTVISLAVAISVSLGSLLVERLSLGSAEETDNLSETAFVSEETA